MKTENSKLSKTKTTLVRKDSNFQDEDIQRSLFEKYHKLLSKSQQNILTLILFEDFSYSEVADELNISKAAVADAYKKGLARLIEIETAIKDSEATFNKEQENQTSSNHLDSKIGKHFMYKRILIKLSGEALANKEQSLQIDYKLVKKIALQLKQLVDEDIQVSVVIGGGNFWRGASAEKNGIPRNRADYIGMLATVMNALALQSGFEQQGLKARVQSSLNIDSRVAENYINEKSIKYLENNEIVIFAGGTGRPYFTTDTASTLFASEIKADAILMGKNNVDGIYSADPNIDKSAIHYDTITYDQVIRDNLKVMDITAISMARDNNLDLVVFNLLEDESIIKAVKGEIKLTRVVKDKK
nr:UMP kinase [Mycoplasmopsis agassizii]